MARDRWTVDLGANVTGVNRTISRAQLLEEIKERYGCDSRVEAFEEALIAAIDFDNLVDEYRSEITDRRLELEYHRLNAQTQLKRK